RHSHDLPRRWADIRTGFLGADLDVVGVHVLDDAADEPGAGTTSFRPTRWRYRPWASIAARLPVARSRPSRGRPLRAKKAGADQGRHRRGSGWQTRDRETLPSRTAKEEASVRQLTSRSTIYHKRRFRTRVTKASPITTRRLRI